MSPVPHPLQLFSPVWYEPVNTRTQVDRMPGTDAPCICAESICGYPFCPWKDYQPDPRPEGTT